MLCLDPTQRISARDAIGHPYFPPIPQSGKYIYLILYASFFKVHEMFVIQKEVIHFH